MRSASGRVPSRDDLAGYFARAHKSMSPAGSQMPQAQEHDMHPLDYTVKFGASPSQLASPVHKVWAWSLSH